MDDQAKLALLPAGLGDLLPPDADHEEQMTRRLLDRFASYGYRRVKPPLVEFETGLLAGVGSMVESRTFRLMDPHSQRMLGVRADITPQIARIAATRLKHAPRPLRLSYSGEVLRVTGNQLRPERQFRQIGVELIGAAKAAMGDAEVILLAGEALLDLGIKDLSIDINTPLMTQAVCDAFDVPEATMAGLSAAIDRKDAAGVGDIGGDAANLLNALISATGPADVAREALNRLDMPGEAEVLRQRLNEVLDLIGVAAPWLQLTIDPVESRGFEYHTGISFTLFAKRARGELGSGGRYLTQGGEPATGFTFYMNNLLSAAPAATPRERVFVPFGTPPETARDLRAQGHIAVSGLTPADDVRAEARRVECPSFWNGTAIEPVKTE